MQRQKYVLAPACMQEARMYAKSERERKYAQVQRGSSRGIALLCNRNKGPLPGVKTKFFFLYF